MKLDLLVKGLVGVTLEGEAVEITAVTHDSRDVVKGALFVALPGRQVDGRAFVRKAVEAGAVAVALPAGTDRSAVDGLGSRPVVWLERPRPALADLCARLHGAPGEDGRLQLVGLTGTNGKSTIATLIAAMIRAAGQPEGVIGTLGNRVAGVVHATRFTTPEAPALQALLAEMLDAGVRTAVMEVTSVGLAEHRVDRVRFAAAGFLNLSVDHLDYHGDMAAYGRAKRALFFEHLRPGGTAVIDVDDAFGSELADALEQRGEVTVWRLSLAGSTDVAFAESTLDGRGIRGVLRTPQGDLALESPLVGRFNASNVAMAAALALAVGLPRPAIVAGLATTQVPGRLQKVPDARGRAVVVDYAHTPDALTRVIETLRPLTEGHLWCVFGCAGDRDRTKRAPMGAAGATADGVVVTSDNPRTEDPTAIAEEVAAGALGAGRPRGDGPGVGHVWVEPDRARAIAATLAAARPGDTVLIAGKGHESYQEIHGVRHPFDDVAVARAALQGGEA